MKNIFLLFFFLVLINSSIFGQIAKSPYPIIFVHGLNDNDGAWETTIGIMGGQQKIFDVCLNHDGNNSKAGLDPSDIDSIGWRDNNPNTPSPTSLYAINFDNTRFSQPGHSSHTLSNQAAIYKQGRALQMMIREVLRIENADKVILVGHSMGGLAIREYLQRTDSTGKHIWWADPTDLTNGHHVAKVVTIGTPHGGSDAPARLVWWKGIDAGSEAIRDLRVSSVYLAGGNESSISTTPFFGFYNSDVNCDGNVDQIIGLNNLSFPNNIKYTWITSNFLNSGGDIVVDITNQWVHDGSLPLPTNISDTLLTDKLHTEEPGDYYSIIRGLDEPDIPSLAYEIGNNSSTRGFITYQKNYYNLDIDLYKIILTNDGYLTISINGNSSSGVVQITLLDSTGVGNPIISQGTTILPSFISYPAKSGTYYISVLGKASNVSWQNPYTLNVNLTDEKLPQTPTLLSPANGASGINYNAVLSWVADTNSYSYQLQVSTDQGFSNSIDSINNIILPSYYLNNLNINTNYYWRVRAINNKGISNWSQVFSFTTAGSSKTLVNGSINQNTTWTFANSPYEISGNITVNQGYTLTIEPGAIIRFRQNTNIFIYGGLICNGSLTQPIAFTSASLQIPGYWGGIKFQSTAISSNCVLNYCNLYYGANNNYGIIPYPVMFDLRVNPTITNTTFNSCKINALGLIGGSYSTDVNIKYYDLPLWLDNDLTLNAGATLTISPGNIFKMAPYRNIYINGGLVANGTLNSPIVFTSYRDDSRGGDSNGDGTSLPVAGDWGGIKFQSTAISSNCVLNYCNLYYAGINVIYIDGVNPLMENSVIDSSLAIGLYLDNQANPDLGGGNRMGIGKNKFFGFSSNNNKYAIYNNGKSNILAKNNYWGTANSSLIASVIYDYSDNSSKGIVYYLKSEIGVTLR